MVGYPQHVSFALAKGFATDLLLSEKGLKKNSTGKYATATAAFSLRCDLSLSFSLFLPLSLSLSRFVGSCDCLRLTDLLDLTWVAAKVPTDRPPFVSPRRLGLGAASGESRRRNFSAWGCARPEDGAQFVSAAAAEFARRRRPLSRSILGVHLLLLLCGFGFRLQPTNLPRPLRAALFPRARW